MTPSPWVPTPNPILTLALFAVEQLIKHAPSLFAGFQELVSRQSITADEIRAKRKEMELQTYESLVTNSELPPEPVVPPTPDVPNAPV